jgi:hypothetical protein
LPQTVRRFDPVKALSRYQDAVLVTPLVLVVVTFASTHITLIRGGLLDPVGGLVAGRVGEARRGRRAERSPLRGLPRDPSAGDRRSRHRLGIRHRIASDFRRRAGPKRRSNADIHQLGWTCENCGPAEGLWLTEAPSTPTVVATFVTLRSSIATTRPPLAATGPFPIRVRTGRPKAAMRRAR